jgi:electron transfer flavoprotein beta subunit
MNIFVLMKQVPGTSNVKMDEKTGTMIRTEHENVINPLDENALEEALRIRRAMPESTVIAVSMGPPPAVKSLREALAMGADSAVLLCHRALAGSDTLATARALAGAIKHVAGGDVGPRDIVLCGERATDGETGQVGPMVAALLDVCVATYVRSIRLEGAESADAADFARSRGHHGASAAVVVERVVEDGFEQVRLSLPCVITVVKDINQPGFPTLAGKIRARKAEVRMLSHEELGLDPDAVGLSGSPTRVVRIFRPSFARSTVLHTQDGSGAAVDAFVNLLADRGFM